MSVQQRIAFRYPATGVDPARLLGARVDSITLHGVNMAGPDMVIVSAAPIEGADELWVVAQNWEESDE